MGALALGSWDLGRTMRLTSNFWFCLSTETSISSNRSTSLRISFAEYGSSPPPSMIRQNLGTSAVVIMAETRSPSGPSSDSSFSSSPARREYWYSDPYQLNESRLLGRCFTVHHGQRHAFSEESNSCVYTRTSSGFHPSTSSRIHCQPELLRADHPEPALCARVRCQSPRTSSTTPRTADANDGAALYCLHRAYTRVRERKEVLEYL